MIDLNADTLETLIRGAALAQAAIASLNLCLPSLLGWREPLSRLPRLLREVFHVHAWFISITLAGFAMLSWRFAGAMAAGHDEIAAWLAGTIGVFWLVRTVIQVTYYSWRHWWGKVAETIVHLALLAVYLGLSWTYVTAALRLA